MSGPAPQVVSIASKLKETTLDFGFVQVPVSVFTAAEDDELDLKSLCHGKPPKMSIRCQEDEQEFSSWQKVPDRGYEWTKGQYVILSAEEIAAAKAQRVKVDSVKVEKAGDFQKVSEEFVYTNPYRLVPPEKANETAKGSFRAIYEVAKETGRAILAKFAPRDKVRTVAVIADNDGALLAYEIRPKKALPYPIPTAAADPKVKTQAKMLIESIVSDDVHITKDPTRCST